MMGVQAIGVVRPHASLGKRFIASVVDNLIALIVAGVFLIPAVLMLARTEEGQLPTSALLLIVAGNLAALVLGLFQWWYQGTRGFTIGKLLVKIRTVNSVSGLPAGMMRILLRQLILGFGSVLVALSTLLDNQGRNRGWHDRAVGTIVIDYAAAAEAKRNARPMARQPVPTSRSGNYATGSAHAALASPASAAPPPPAPTSVPGTPAPAPAPAQYPAPPQPAAPAGQPYAPAAASARPALTLPPYLMSSQTPPRPAAPQRSPHRAPQQTEPPAPQPAPAQPYAQPAPAQAYTQAAPQPQSAPPMPASPPVPPAPPAPPAPQPAPAQPYAQPDQGPSQVDPPVQAAEPQLQAAYRQGHVYQQQPGTPEPEAVIVAAPGFENRVREELSDDVEMTRLTSGLRHDEPEASAIPPSATLNFSDGRQVTLTETVLIGRNPKPGTNEVIGELIRVSDPGRSVSKTHVLVGVDGEGVWVIDRASTNGTIVTLADGQQIICSPHQVVRLPAGSQVTFGDYSISFEYRNN